MKKITALFVVLCMVSGIFVNAQDNSRLRISLLTCTPGQELYSTFGHSALRVIDSNAVTDIVYNYGTFDFTDKDFYYKFVRGKLMYYESIEPFADFKASYIYENRGITEQVLNLTPQEEYELRNALNENLKEENRYYKYDFFLDNCTTRLRDLIEKYKKPTPQLPAVMPETYTFRNAIHQYLDANKNYWSKWGIDLLLGARTDAVMSKRQQQFLPDNLMYALDSTKNTTVVKEKMSVFTNQPSAWQSHWFTPMICTITLLVLLVLLSLSRKTYALYKSLEFLLLFVTGILGILLVFMWVGTDHSMTKNNYNLLWALPTNVVFAFLAGSKKTYVKQYFGFVFLLSMLLMVFFKFLPQQLNYSNIPIIIALAFLSYKQWRKN